MFDHATYLAEVEKQKSKAAVCEEHGIDVFIEDTLRHAEEAADSGVDSIVMAQPWNRGTALPRVQSWGALRHIYGAYLQPDTTYSSLPSMS